MVHPNVILFKVLKLLQERQTPLSEDEISSELQISQDDFDNVRDMLKTNARILSVDNTFQFRPLVVIKSVDDIERYFAACLDSVIKSEDIQSPSLVSSLRAHADGSHDSICIETKGANYNLYHNDLKCKRLPSDLVTLWRDAS